MNIDNIEFELKYINQVGLTLDMDERVQLELLFNHLSHTHPSDRLRFWGKIEGNVFNQALQKIII
jgi:hypothetical protein